MDDEPTTARVSGPVELCAETTIAAFLQMELDGDYDVILDGKRWRLGAFGDGAIDVCELPEARTHFILEPRHYERRAKTMGDLVGMVTGPLAPGSAVFAVAVRLITQGSIESGSVWAGQTATGSWSATIDGTPFLATLDPSPYGAAVAFVKALDQGDQIEAALKVQDAIQARTHCSDVKSIRCVDPGSAMLGVRRPM